MQGPIENALMLAGAGNAYLAGRDISGFWPNAATFTYMKVCEFRTPTPSGEGDFPLVAADPMAWFETLKPWCKGLRLHFAERDLEPGQMPGMKPRMMVGFVGGGPRWLVECVGPKGSELWEGFNRLGDRKDPDQKIWLTTYIRQGEVKPEEVTPNRLDDALVVMRKVLPEIERYARSEKLDSFADCFARAKQALDGPASEATDYTDQFVQFIGANDAQVRALIAVMDAWVFGGMGSWNDTGGGERYEELSEQLFDGLCATVCGLANSFCKAA
jgi:hypothetical protein